MLRVGIIGCGRVSSFHVNSYSRIQEVSIVGICDIDRGKADELADELSCRAYSSIDEMLAQDKYDLISVCTPHHTHFKIAKKIIQTGTNIIIEKPICLNENEALELIALRDKNNVIASVCFQNIFNPEIEYLFSIKNNGCLGNIKMSNITMRWYRKDEYYQDWHGIKEESGGGVLMTQAIHMLDILRRMNDDILEVKGFQTNFNKNISIDDALVANIRFSNGGIGVLDLTSNAAPLSFEGSISFVCDNGCIKIGGKSMNIVEYNTIDGAPALPVVRGDVHEYGTSHYDLLKNVVETINGQAQIRSTLEDGLATLRAVKKIYKETQLI